MLDDRAQHFASGCDLFGRRAFKGLLNARFDDPIVGEIEDPSLVGEAQQQAAPVAWILPSAHQPLAFEPLQDSRQSARMDTEERRQMTRGEARESADDLNDQELWAGHAETGLHAFGSPL
jgi:hypothetical protein